VDTPSTSNASQGRCTFDDSYAVFGSDGTYVDETTYIGAGIGSWQSSREPSADLIIVYQDLEGGLDPNQPDAFVPGSLKMWSSLEVATDGSHLTATRLVEIHDVDGKLVDHFTFNGTATRLGLDWVESRSRHRRRSRHSLRSAGWWRAWKRVVCWRARRLRSMPARSSSA
jgi:hypothetical protein